MEHEKCSVIKSIALLANAKGWHEYIGPHVFVGDSLEYSAFPGGYFTPDGVFYYITDWQGNNIAVFSDKGELVQQTTYYPYGEPTIEPTGQRYLFGGKEREHAGGRNSYDFVARNLGSSANWDSPDKLATDTPQTSPFSYCGGDPINRVDPTGMSTWVLHLGEEKYEIVGGDLEDNDLNIYVGYFDENNTFIKGESIGETTSITSFYDSDKSEWAEGSIIDRYDLSGWKFFNFIKNENPSLFLDYIPNAKRNEQYDFKNTNGIVNYEGPKLDIYRGMPLFENSHGQIVFTSARDIGNISAGYMAAANGMPLVLTRLAFDIYQSVDLGRIAIEGKSTQNAEWYGYSLGKYETDVSSKLENLIKAVHNVIKSIF